LTGTTTTTTTSFGDPLTSLAAADNDDRPEITSSTASDDDVLLLAPSSDVHDIAVIVQLTHGNIIALWTQLWCVNLFTHHLCRKYVSK